MFVFKVLFYILIFFSSEGWNLDMCVSIMDL